VRKRPGGKEKFYGGIRGEQRTVGNQSFKQRGKKLRQRGPKLKKEELRSVTTRQVWRTIKYKKGARGPRGRVSRGGQWGTKEQEETRKKRKGNAEDTGGERI